MPFPSCCFPLLGSQEHKLAWKDEHQADLTLASESATSCPRDLGSLLNLSASLAPGRNMETMML